MSKLSIICLIAAAVITAINLGCTIVNIRRRKAMIAWGKTIEDMRKLTEYQKRRMCDKYCRYIETTETQEELDWICANCPVGEL